ncbi:MAG TPA: type II toxin-antitoxin system RelE/ParE family toxin [Dietzia timorensis]|uniref:Type II toxin-antitoxin system RelE/ParE family toxin n=1 Tax=Dietzia timorensis TaxID=499555 RepID=A0A921JZ39_9ACTN|nr:type II toxin-antitoxin system RelE/ParE family toxin [Dietzia timorensis]HJE91789.1 type II toxin-antitoxin system RelE/ParE family toxin [Dietzia timorensis]
MIRSFADSQTAKVWNREKPRKMSLELTRRAHRKLLILNRAATLNDLHVPPGNHLEKLAGGRAGQHSIRVNKQFRICFRWTESGPADVEITDYH